MFSRRLALMTIWLATRSPHLRPAQIDQGCSLGPGSSALLDRAMQQLGLSARACHRILKLARLIADLQQAEKSSEQDPAQAIRYRSLDSAW